MTTPAFTLLLSPAGNTIAFRASDAKASTPWTVIALGKSQRVTQTLKPFQVAHWEPLMTAEQAEWAMFGTTDGDLVSDDAELPVGELRRLLHEGTSAVTG